LPKKKLTKAQVKKKMKTAFNAIYDLEMDKLGQMDSFVPMSVGKLLEISDTIKRAHKRL
tara:strand:- start:44 stop:220 length:177 start_codon:yes stop_codon:yes gene_type:complete